MSEIDRYRDTVARLEARLRAIALEFDGDCQVQEAEYAWTEMLGRVRQLKNGLKLVAKDRADLKALINTPEILDFVKAVRLEAVHQRDRWGSGHDAEKTDADWYWLLGWLGSKAVHTPADDPDKRLHRIVTVAAAAANWHAARLKEKA